VVRIGTSISGLASNVWPRTSLTTTIDPDLVCGVVPTQNATFAVAAAAVLGVDEAAPRGWPDPDEQAPVARTAASKIAERHNRPLGIAEFCPVTT
jgi:hypothetical protein